MEKHPNKDEGFGGYNREKKISYDVIKFLT